MTKEQIKEANRYYWIIKGQLIPESWTSADVARIYEGYFKRMWGNHENVVHEDGFEAAWQERMEREMDNIAVRGYD